MELAKWNKKRVVYGNEIIGIVLPCTYFGAFNELSKIIFEEKPDAIISTGLSSSIHRIRIETTFRNLMSNDKYKDNDGLMLIDKKINESTGAQEFICSTADNSGLAKILEFNNIPNELSTDASGFICNSLAYLTTQMILSENLQIKNMFIHTPWTNDYREKIQLDEGKIFLEKDLLYRAIDLLIEHI